MDNAFGNNQQIFDGKQPLKQRAMKNKSSLQRRHGWIRSLRYILTDLASFGASVLTLALSEDAAQCMTETRNESRWRVSQLHQRVVDTVDEELCRVVDHHRRPLDFGNNCNGSQQNLSTHGAITTGGNAEAASGLKTGPVDMASTDATIAAAVLAVREGCSLLGAMVQYLPLQPDAHDVNSTSESRGGSKKDHKCQGGEDDYERGISADASTWLLSRSAVMRSGQVIIRAVLQLPHMGAMSAASEALESIVTKLLLASRTANPNSSGDALIVKQWRHDVLQQQLGIDQRVSTSDGVGAAAEHHPQSDIESVASDVLRRSTGLCTVLLALLRPLSVSQDKTAAKPGICTHIY